MLLPVACEGSSEPWSSSTCSARIEPGTIDVLLTIGLVYLDGTFLNHEISIYSFVAYIRMHCGTSFST